MPQRQPFPAWVLPSAGAVLLIGLYLLLSPHITAYEYRRISTGTGMLTMDIAARAVPQRASLRVDGCVVWARMDGRMLAQTGGCPLYETELRLPAGTSRIEMALRSRGVQPPVRLLPDGRDPLWILTSLLLALIALACAPLKACTPRRAALLAMLAAGAMLRVGYAGMTPLGTRTHDVWAHVQYMNYMLSGWTLPPASAGWEFHQPPLHYLLAIGWHRLAEKLGSAGTVAFHLQPMVTLLSLFSMFASVWVARILIPPGKDARPNLLLTALLVFSPWPVLLASQGGNDSLFHLCALLAAGALLQWWRSGKGQDWLSFCALSGLSILTKMTGLLFLPIAALCILARPATAAGAKVRQALTWLAMTSVLTGPLFLRRVFVEHEYRRYMVPDVGNAMGKLQAGSTPEMFLTFNPLRLLREPFNRLIAPDDSQNFFWEFLYRSVFFGEWTFDDRLRGLGTAIIALGLLWMALALWGMVHEWRKRSPWAVPLTAVTALFLTASVYYRLNLPCVCNQNFRFVTPLLIPLAYFGVRGAAALPKALRLPACALLALMPVLWGAFYLLV